MTPNKQPLLSICIPTYNRAEYLRGALENITSDPEFNQRIEVIISDNASTDNTQEIGLEYAAKFSNIKYFKNAKNVRDANFKLAFNRASGKYLKLFNDTLRFTSGSLKTILNIIESNQDGNIIFYYDKEPKKTKITVNTKDELVNNISFFITWIGNFGIYKDDLNLINSNEKYTHLLLPQVSWLLDIVHKKKICLYYGDWYISIFPKKKGGYNVFQVFTTNYFSILRDYKISSSVLKKEKYRLFRYFLLNYIYGVITNKPIGNFDYHNMWKILFKHYKFCPYFYILTPMYYLKRKLDSLLK